mmetsp:Transcript_3396/g.13692  ORF Transcript_3396/g.13692 Transcript_3396/m.13692 type:complete len:289 (+) Transcript_3396:873-1739(+)
MAAQSRSSATPLGMSNPMSHERPTPPAPAPQKCDSASSATRISWSNKRAVSESSNPQNDVIPLETISNPSSASPTERTKSASLGNAGKTTVRPEDKRVAAFGFVASSPFSKPPPPSLTSSLTPESSVRESSRYTRPLGVKIAGLCFLTFSFSKNECSRHRTPARSMFGKLNTWSCGHDLYGGFTSAPPMKHSGRTFPQYRSHAQVISGRMAMRFVARATASRLRTARRYHAAASRWLETDAEAIKRFGGPSLTSIATNLNRAPGPADSGEPLLSSASPSPRASFVIPP